MTWTAIAAYVLDQVFGFQDANELRVNILALAAVGHRKELGGSRQTSVPLVAAAQDAIDYADVKFRAVPPGLTYDAEVEVRTDDAATSVTPKIRDITAAADAVVGAACVATVYTGTNAKQTLNFTPVVNHIYRLQLTPGNAANGVYGLGHIEIYATA